MLITKNEKATKIKANSAGIHKINQHNLYVEFWGPLGGPVVILLHHGLGSVRSWKDQSAYFAALGYRLMVYDRWGYGKSGQRSHFSMPHFDDDLADLEGLMDKFKIDRATLIGHSDGGTISLYFASQRPEQVTSLITVAAHIFVEDPMQAGMYAIQEAYECDDEFQDKLRRIHGEKTEAVFWGWRNGWMRSQNLSWDMRRQLQTIRCPTLVIQGANDEHATSQHAREIAKAIAGSELWLEPEAGHMLPQEISEVFNRRVSQFLKRYSKNVQ